MRVTIRAQLRRDESLVILVYCPQKATGYKRKYSALHCEAGVVCGSLCPVVLVVGTLTLIICSNKCRREKSLEFNFCVK
jgi:hypothetical protein